MAQHWAQSLDRHTGVAVVVADAGSGAVLAHLGSPDFFDGHRAGQVDMTRAVRSPGSTLKPLLYGLAFDRSEEHTSELQSLMRISYAVFCLKKKKPDRRTVIDVATVSLYTNSPTKIIHTHHNAYR